MNTKQRITLYVAGPSLVLILIVFLAGKNPSRVDVEPPGASDPKTSNSRPLGKEKERPRAPTEKQTSPLYSKIINQDSSLLPADYWSAAMTIDADHLAEFIHAITTNSSLNGQLKWGVMAAAAKSAAATDDIRKVYEIVAKNLEEGQHRDKMILAVFNGTRNNFAETYGLLKELDSADEIKSAMGGLVLKISTSTNLDELGIDGSLLNGTEGKRFASALGMRLSKESKLTQLDSFNKSLSIVKKAPAGQEGLMANFLSSSASTLPFESWKAWNEMELWKTKDGQAYETAFLKSMVATDPLKAVETVKESSNFSTNAATERLRLVANSWRANSPGAFSAWWSQSKTDFSQETRDAVTADLALYNLSIKEPDAARQWIAEIGDEGMRAELSKKLK